MELVYFTCGISIIAAPAIALVLPVVTRQSDQLSFNYVGCHTVTIRTSDESELLIDDSMGSITP
jgi:hypothetical protein